MSDSPFLSDSPSSGSLVNRLAVARLVAPGVLDQRKLQSVAQRFAAPTPGASTVGRLMQRGQATTPSVPSAAGLVLTRPQILEELSQHPEVSEPSPARRDAASAISVGERMAWRASVPRQAGGPVAGLNGASHSSVAHAAVPGAPDISHTANTPNRSLAFAPIQRMADGGGVIQRVVDRSVSSSSGSERARGAAVAAPAAYNGSATHLPLAKALSPNEADPIPLAGPPAAASGQPILMRKVEAGAALPVAHPISRARAANGGSTFAGAGTGNDIGTSAGPVAPHLLAGVPSPHAMSAPTRMLWRKPIAGAGESAAGPAASASSVAPAISITRTTQSLVFRKSLAVPATPPATDTPSITRTPTSVISRKAEAPASKAKDAPISAPAAARDRSIDLDWMTREVSSRLARQLEIERERLGVRTWRPSSF